MMEWIYVVCIAMFCNTDPSVSLGTKTLVSMFNSWSSIVLVLSLSFLFLLAFLDPFLVCCPFPFPAALDPCFFFLPHIIPHPLFIPFLSLIILLGMGPLILSLPLDRHTPTITSPLFSGLCSIRLA